MKQLRHILFLLIPFTALGQYEPLARNAFINAGMQDAFDYWAISKPSVKFHSSFKPYLSSTHLHASDSGIPFRFYSFRNFFLSQTFNESPQRRIWYNLQVVPLAEAESGYDLLTKKPVFTTFGGAHIKLNVNNDFTFAGTVVGGKQAFPFFNDTLLSATRIIPEYGQGYGKYGSGYRFFDYTGYLSYSPGKHKIFNFQLGRDKHFIGDGYRSLLLSDFAPAYPYLRINTNVWRFQYNVWYTWMTDVTYAGGLKKNYKDKFGTFHYLSYNIVKEFSVGLFENIIWKGTDTNQVRQFDPNYLNPVIFLRPVEYSVGSSDNAFMGLNLNATIYKRIKLYGQLAVDEFLLREIRNRSRWWGNKQGVQVGAKYINAFRVKGLKLQAEYNVVRPYTYSHGDVIQNYGHYGMPLAHPLGANFREYMGFISYRKNTWELSLQLMSATVGMDTTGSKYSSGQNIFVSYNTRVKRVPDETGHFIGQGIKTQILQSHLRLTYFIIPDMNLRFEMGYVQRSQENALGYVLQNPYLYLGIKTSFWNIYRDF